MSKGSKLKDIAGVRTVSIGDVDDSMVVQYVWYTMGMVGINHSPKAEHWENFSFQLCMQQKIS